jgi:hypothetical protein
MNDVELPDVGLGTEVLDRQGRSLGKVTAVHPGYVVVERGWLLPAVLYIPRDVITVEGSKARVGVTREEAFELGWQWEPGTIPFGTEPPPREPVPLPPAPPRAPGHAEHSQ